MTMKKAYIILSGLCFAAALCSCSKDPASETSSGGERELQLEGLMAQYAQGSTSQQVPLEKGREVYIWADAAGESYFNAWTLTADGQGGFISSKTKYFPAENQSLDLYAVHGNFPQGQIAEDTSPFPAEGLACSVPADQSAQEAYDSSDLLYAAEQGVEATDIAVTMRFHHLLADVQVTLKPGDGISDDDLAEATVHMLNLKTQGLFLPRKLPARELENPEVRSSMLRLSEDGNTPQRITLHRTDAGHSAAVVLPQEIDGELIEVLLSDGTRLAKSVEESKFEGGYSYLYEVSVGRESLDITCSIKEWGAGGDIDLKPDWDGKITVDTQVAALPEGVAVNEAKDELSISHLPVSFTVALNCAQELELVTDADAETVNNTMVVATPAEERNCFRIQKRLLPPGHETQRATLRFRRKGLTEVYPEDKIELILEKNPTAVTGSLQFDMRSASCDFAAYVDGELGSLTLPQGRKAEVTFPEGEDAWMKLAEPEAAPETDAGISNTVRVLGGWRPNDPKADGREQKALLTISDEDGLRPEVYTIVRRNWGLPVVKVGDVYWCKYNLRGDSRSFEDQILVKDDPTADTRLWDHLKSCSEDELLKLLGDQYQGNQPQGLKLAYDDAKQKYYFNGMKPKVTDWGQVSETAMTPSGYRLPKSEDWQKLVPNQNYNLKGPGTRTYTVGGKTMTISIVERDMTLLGHKYGIIDFYEFQLQGDDQGRFVICGLGHQQTTTPGDIIRMNILLATVGVIGKSWYMEGYATSEKKDENWFKYTSHNSTKTRVIRCIKTPVEYMY